MLAPFAGSGAQIHAVPVPDHAHHAPAAIVAAAQAHKLVAVPEIDPAAALGRIAHGSRPGRPPIVLIAGSLYLAGAMLALNETPPD